MYAVIQTGGKQYRVKAGDVLKIEQIPVTVGTVVKFDKVLMVSNEGSTLVEPSKLESANVEAEVLEHGRHKKVKIIKFRRRKHHMKQMGHRQNFTAVQIKAIHS